MVFDKAQLKRLFRPHNESNGEDNGQVTIIGGSHLFHGAPNLALIVASRIVDMVFFATPQESVGRVAENIKSRLMSFIWIPWEDLDNYIEKSDAILIGPGFMSYRNEKDRSVVHETKEITEKLLRRFAHKKWVIDAGSLQTMDAKFIPENSILTPNKKEYEIIFKNQFSISNAKEMSQRYKCVIVVKGPTTYVFGDGEMVEVRGGNPGLTKGGTGDVQAGLTVALFAKNEPMLSACVGSFITKAAADQLAETRGIYYNADDLANKIPEVLFSANDALK